MHILPRQSSAVTTCSDYRAYNERTFSCTDVTVGVARSVRTYKGKIILLVRAHSSSLCVVADFD